MRKSKFKTVCISALLLMVLTMFWQCGQQQDKTVVARINKRNIYKSELLRLFQHSQIGKETVSKDQVQTVLRDLLERYLIVHDADQARFLEDLRIKNSLANMRNLVYYRAAIQDIFDQQNTKKAGLPPATMWKRPSDNALYKEAHELLRKYSFRFLEAEVMQLHRFLAHPSRKQSSDEVFLKTVVAEFSGGNVLMGDVLENKTDSMSIEALRDYILELARRKVFAVYTIKNQLNEDPVVREECQFQQNEYVAERYELVQFNKFLNSIDRKRVNISQASIENELQKLPPGFREKWNQWRKKWIADLESEHKFFISNQSLELAYREILGLGKKS